MVDRSQRAVRFIRAQLAPISEGRSQALVEIAWTGTGNFTGTAEGGAE